MSSTLQCLLPACSQHTQYDWTGCQIISAKPPFPWKVGPHHLSRSLLTWALLWFCTLNRMVKAENIFSKNTYFNDLYLLVREMLYNNHVTQTVSFISQCKTRIATDSILCPSLHGPCAALLIASSPKFLSYQRSVSLLFFQQHLDFRVQFASMLMY